MDLTRRKVILISSAVIAVIFISCALIYKVNSGKFNTPGKYEYLKQGHSLSEKKRFDENMGYAKKYNARIKNIDNLSTPAKGSIAPDVQKVSEAEKSNPAVSLYFLFSKKVLNTDQYIDTETKLNNGIKGLSDIENSEDLNEYFNEKKDTLKKTYGISNYNQLENLKSRFVKLNGSTVNVTVDKNSAKTDNSKVSFTISLSNNKNCSVNQTIILSYSSDIEMNVSWQI